MSKCDEIKQQRHELASQAAKHALEQLQLPNEIVITKDSFDGLPGKFGGRACRLLGLFESKLGDHLPKAIANELRDIWFDAFYLAYIGDRCTPEAWLPEGAQSQRVDATLALVQEFGGWVSLFPETRQGLLAEMEGAKPFSRFDGLGCLTLYWFSEAASQWRNGDFAGALEWLYEATTALEFCYGWDMWDSAVECLGPSDHVAVGKASRTAQAKHGAGVRHRENRSLKSDVFRWLDAHFSECSSMDSAAEKIAGAVVPMKFRTVRAWVTEWKKLRSAGTA